MPRSPKGEPNKSDFIRANSTLSVKQIIEKAKAAGMTITPTLVYKARRRKVKAAAPAAPAANAPAGAGTKATKAAKKAPGKRGPKPTKGGLSASDFVRSLPDLPAKEVVAKGAARGIKFSTNLVYAVRSKPGATSKTGAKAVPMQRAARGPGRPARAAAGGGAPEAVFAKLIIEHGIGTVREFLAAAEARVARVLSGLG